MASEDKRYPIDAILERVRRFAQMAGRRPRILLARTGCVESDREMKAIAATFSDKGFDVDIFGKVRSPAQVAATAVENDVHALGVVGVEAGQNELLTDINCALASAESQEILVAAWRRVSPAEKGAGVDTGHSGVILFDADDTSIDAVERILDILESRL